MWTCPSKRPEPEASSRISPSVYCSDSCMANSLRQQIINKAGKHRLLLAAFAEGETDSWYCTLRVACGEHQAILQCTYLRLWRSLQKSLRKLKVPVDKKEVLSQAVLTAAAPLPSPRGLKAVAGVKCSRVTLCQAATFSDCVHTRSWAVLVHGTALETKVKRTQERRCPRPEVSRRTPSNDLG